MAIRSGFFNSVNGDRKYDASRFAEYFASFIGNGVFPNPSDGLQVMANDDMTVTVKAGKAWINGYILINDDDYILTLEPADGVLDRIDRIVARYDVADREMRIEVKKGTFASSPVPPDLQRDVDAYELALADIYVGAGVVSIAQGNITDLRNDKDLCGRVNSLIAGDVQSIADTLNAHLADDVSHGKMVFGSYIGNGITDRLINVGFKPSIVFIFFGGGKIGYIYGDGTLSAWQYMSTGNAFTLTREFTNEGFVLRRSDANSFNELDVTYNYIALG